MITTVTGSGLRCRDNSRPHRRVTDSDVSANCGPSSSQETDEPTVTVNFTSLLLLALLLVFVCAFVATLVVR